MENFANNHFMILKNLKLCSTLDVVKNGILKNAKLYIKLIIFTCGCLIVIFKECFLSLILFIPFSMDMIYKILYI